jgi:hypothetical protein
MTSGINITQQWNSTNASIYSSQEIDVVITNAHKSHEEIESLLNTYEITELNRSSNNDAERTNGYYLFELDMEPAEGPSTENNYLQQAQHEIHALAIKVDRINTRETLGRFRLAAEALETHPIKTEQSTSLYDLLIRSFQEVCQPLDDELYTLQSVPDMIKRIQKKGKALSLSITLGKQYAASPLCTSADNKHRRGNPANVLCDLAEQKLLIISDFLKKINEPLKTIRRIRATRSALNACSNQLHSATRLPTILQQEKVQEVIRTDKELVDKVDAAIAAAWDDLARTLSKPNW